MNSAEVKIIPNLKWNWKGKFIPINVLHTNQLNHIRNFVGVNPKTYFNVTSEEWIVNLKYQMDVKRIDNMISNQIKNKTLSTRG